MGESTTKYSGLKWTVQLTAELAQSAERARRMSGQSRQELLSAALAEYIERHQSEWLAEFQAQFAASDVEPVKPAKK